MSKVRKKIINGKTFHFFRSYAHRNNAELKAKILKEKGIKKNGYRIYYRNIRIVKTTYMNKKNPRPFYLYVYGKHRG